jgi:hypothetical protein
MKKVTKKILWAGGIIFLCLFIIYLSFLYLTHLKIKNGDLIKWDNKWYTKEQLQKKYPPQEYEIESKNTPEETYSAFRQALLDDDIEEALSMITEDKREMYREAFEDEEKFNNWIKTLPEKIDGVKVDGNYSHYDWDKNDDYYHSIDFEKNFDGYWEIDSI